APPRAPRPAFAEKEAAPVIPRRRAALKTGSPDAHGPSSVLPGPSLATQSEVTHDGPAFPKELRRWVRDSAPTRNRELDIAECAPNRMAATTPRAPARPPGTTTGLGVTAPTTRGTRASHPGSSQTGRRPRSFGAPCPPSPGSGGGRPTTRPPAAAAPV